MELKKIHIIGSVGSGKTTFARRLAKQLGINHYEIDNIVYKRRVNEDLHDVKRTSEERDAYFAEILRTDAWIVEGVHSFDWVIPSMQQADVVILLDTKFSVRRYRIIRRFILQKLGREKANYVPSLKIFWRMFKWNRMFEDDRKHILKMIEKHNGRAIFLKNSREVESYIEELGKNGIRDGLKKASRI